MASLHGPATALARTSIDGPLPSIRTARAHPGAASGGDTIGEAKSGGESKGGSGESASDVDASGRRASSACDPSVDGAAATAGAPSPSPRGVAATATHAVAPPAGPRSLGEHGDGCGQWRSVRQTLLAGDASASFLAGAMRRILGEGGEAEAEAVAGAERGAAAEEVAASLLRRAEMRGMMERAVATAGGAAGQHTVHASAAGSASSLTLTGQSLRGAATEGAALALLEAAIVDRQRGDLSTAVLGGVLGPASSEAATFGSRQQQQQQQQQRRLLGSGLSAASSSTMSSDLGIPPGLESWCS